MAALEIVWRNPKSPRRRQWRVKKGVAPGIYVVDVFFPENDRWASLFALTLKDRVRTEDVSDPMDAPVASVCAWQG
jgi:hypothetical protein